MARKIYVGMSGGVDSSLSAALLVAQGYSVTGVYMKNWTENEPGMRCPWADDLADAKRVAVKLNIPFKVFDFQKEYRHLVVDYMIDEYKRGRTPNPDIMCNQEVKFGLFLRAALADGADLIATGHYARSSSQHLLRAANEAKDQTYFLYRVTGDAIARTIFPIGEYQSKAEVRADAAKFGLSTAEKHDSQGICFIGTVNIRDFLAQYVQTEPGNIIDRDSGQVVGEHDGALFYTLGQRHGLNVGGGLPYYVVGKDMANNIVYVSRNLNDRSFWRETLTLSSLHWINVAPKQGNCYFIRVRHRAPLVPAKLERLDDTHAIIRPDEPVRAVAAGQSIVLYAGGGTPGQFLPGEVIGGGIAE